MNILYYDLTNYSVDDVAEVVRYISSRGIEIIAIPKDFDLLLDCDTFTLNLIKQKIEDAIQKKKIIEGA
jgi:hypothetical protein